MRRTHHWLYGTPPTVPRSWPKYYRCTQSRSFRKYPDLRRHRSQRSKSGWLSMGAGCECPAKASTPSFAALASGASTPASTSSGLAFDPTPSTLTITDREHDQISKADGGIGVDGSVEPKVAGSRLMTHACPTTCMTRKSADGTACIVAASAACRASTSAGGLGFQPHGQPSSQRC